MPTLSSNVASCCNRYWHGSNLGRGHLVRLDLRGAGTGGVRLWGMSSLVEHSVRSDSCTFPSAGTTSDSFISSSSGSSLPRYSASPKLSDSELAQSDGSTSMLITSRESAALA